MYQCAGLFGTIQSFRLSFWEALLTSEFDPARKLCQGEDDNSQQYRYALMLDTLEEPEAKEI
jgi:hypothetical protein